MLKSTVLKGVAQAKVALQDLVVDGQLIKRGEVQYVPGSNPVYPETSDSIKLVITAFTFQEIDGDRIRASDMQGLLWPEDAFVQVAPNDLLKATVTGVSNTWRVLSNVPIMAGDQVALHQLHLRLM